MEESTLSNWKKISTSTKKNKTERESKKRNNESKINTKMTTRKKNFQWRQSLRKRNSSKSHTTTTSENVIQYRMSHKWKRSEWEMRNFNDKGHMVWLFRHLLTYSSAFVLEINWILDILFFLLTVVYISNYNKRKRIYWRSLELSTILNLHKKALQ